MTERVRVYHPETDEPFDLPQAKAADLRLNHGWRSHPIDRNAQRAVTTVEPEKGTGTDSEDSESEDWRDFEVGDEH